MRPPVAGLARICEARLADDGIVDPIAVDIAARGTRPVQLTETERLAAVALLLARGGSLSLAAYRMRMSFDTVREIVAEVRAAGNPGTVREVA
jgi:hypothetical protein